MHALFLFKKPVWDYIAILMVSSRSVVCIIKLVHNTWCSTIVHKIVPITTVFIVLANIYIIFKHIKDYRHATILAKSAYYCAHNLAIANCER